MAKKTNEIERILNNIEDSPYVDRDDERRWLRRQLRNLVKGAFNMGYAMADDSYAPSEDKFKDRFGFKP